MLKTLGLACSSRSINFSRHLNDCTECRSDEALASIRISCKSRKQSLLKSRSGIIPLPSNAQDAAHCTKHGSFQCFDCWSAVSYSQVCDGQAQLTHHTPSVAAPSQRILAETLIPSWSSLSRRWRRKACPNVMRLAKSQRRRRKSRLCQR